MNRPSPLPSVQPGFSRARAALALAFSLLAASGAHAANGTWIGATTPLNWDDAANWAGGVVADGADFTADFGAADLTAYTYVHLAASRTIGNIIFGDTDLSTPGSWHIPDVEGAPKILTLSGSAPTITVPDLGAGQFVVISPPSPAPAA